MRNKLLIGLGVASAFIGALWIVIFDKLGILGMVPFWMIIWMLPALCWSLGILFGYLATRTSSKFGGIYTMFLNVFTMLLVYLTNPFNLNLL
jgi:hypothetical protein